MHTIEQAPWETAALRPDIVAADKEIRELDAFSNEYSGLYTELDDYFWSGGLPYTRISQDGGNKHSSIGWDQFRHSFSWDVPERYGLQGMLNRIRREPRFINEQREQFSVIGPFNENLQIVRGENGLYLCADKKRRISPDVDELVPRDESSLQVSKGDEQAVLHVLTSDEQAELLAKRARYGEYAQVSMEKHARLTYLQRQSALATLALYGLPGEEDPRPRSSVNATTILFALGEKLVRLTVHNSALAVHSKLVPNSSERDSSDYWRNQLNFSINTPHPSWSIPTAIALLALPHDEVFRVLGRLSEYDTYTDACRQFRPGGFVAKLYSVPQVWNLDSAGMLQPFETPATR